MMKAICLVTFLTCFVVVITAHQSEQSIPSFLKFIGSYKYNTTDNGKITLKRYYSSHRIIYKWIEAYTICKSVGMRLAFIESDNERNNLAAMGRKNSKLFERKIFVDGYNLTVTEFDYESDGSEKEPCFSAQKYRRGKLEIRSEKCNVELNRFLCERMEIVDSYDEHQASDDKIDVKGTFFAHIGSFETKQYYASFKLKAHSSDVPKICRSFGMQMASPKDQAEYDNLGRLLQEFNDKWNSVSIAGYRSDDNESEWVVSNRKPNYEMEWGDGEPNNRGESEDCIALKNNGRPKMNDIPCHSDDQFVCESDESITDVNIPHQIDPLLLKPLTDYKIDSTHRKELFISLFNVDWITANLMCRTSGMELFTPSSTADDETFRNKLIKFTGISDSLHVGITSMGTEDVWYSVSTGEILDFDLEWAPQYSSMYYASNTNCLKVRKSYEKYAYDAIACTNTPNHFICQKVVEATEDQQTTTSKSPAS